MAENSTALFVSWDAVPRQSRNGIIIVYEVMFDPQETFGGIIFDDSVNTTAMSATILFLQEYVVYNVSVRAYTSAGAGPFSAEIPVRTLEDGEVICSYKLQNLLSFFLCSSI